MRRTTTTAVAVALAGMAWVGLSDGPVATAGPAAPAQAVDPTITVEPTAGTAEDSFTVTGTGCDQGFGIVSVDGKQLMFQPDRGGGTWTVTDKFPAEVGAHTISAECRDQTTAGTPTTFYGPGDLRFAYDDVEIETMPIAPVEVTQPPETRPEAPAEQEPAPVEAAPAQPTAATPSYTG